MTCTRHEGMEIYRVFDKYYRGRKVDDGDRKVLDSLYEASYIDYEFRGGVMYARASRKGWQFKKAYFCRSLLEF